jgi:hypothetical protein
MVAPFTWTSVIMSVRNIFWNWSSSKSWMLVACAVAGSRLVSGLVLHTTSVMPGDSATDVSAHVSEKSSVMVYTLGVQAQLLCALVTASKVESSTQNSKTDVASLRRQGPLLRLESFGCRSDSPPCFLLLR